MFISHTDVGDNLRKIVILGRLDIMGTESVAGELEKLAAALTELANCMNHRSDVHRLNALSPTAMRIRSSS